MNVPDSFWKVCERFFQDLPEFYPTEEKALGFVVGGLTPAERIELAGFLDEVLRKPDASAILARLWRTSQADFYITPERHIDELFAKIRKRL